MEPSGLAGQYQKFSWDIQSDTTAVLQLYDEKTSLSEAVDDTNVVDQTGSSRAGRHVELLTRRHSPQRARHRRAHAVSRSHFRKISITGTSTSGFTTGISNVTAPSGDLWSRAGWTSAELSRILTSLASCRNWA